MVFNLDVTLLDQVRIWEGLLSSRIVPNRAYKNPTRYDKDPSCKLICKDGILILYDHSFKTSLNCVTCYSQLYSVSYNKAYELLYNNNNNVVKRSDSYKVDAFTNSKAGIQINPKRFNKESLNFWNKRWVSREQLERKETPVNYVDSYKIIYENKSREYFPNDLCFSYKFDNGVKLYFPEREKPRFKSSGDKNSVWFLNRGSDKLVVCKANKDFLVVENLCDYDLLSISSEGSIPDMFNEIKDNYKMIYATHDPDSAGVLAVEKLREIADVKHLHTNFDQGLKDWDDYMTNTNYNKTLNYFRERCQKA